MSQLVHIRLEKSLQKDIRDLIDNDRYATQSEFIKEAIRMRLNEVYRDEALKEIAKLKGSSEYKHMTQKKRKEAVDEYISSSRDIFKEYGLE